MSLNDGSIKTFFVHSLFSQLEIKPVSWSEDLCRQLVTATLRFSSNSLNMNESPRMSRAPEMNGGGLYSPCVAVVVEIGTDGT